MKYIDADKLIAEIERLKKHSQEAKMEFIDVGYNQNAFAEDCRLRSFDKLLSFITSLQQEQLEVDLEKEIENWCDKNITGERPIIYTANSLIYCLLPKTARHFYELGLNARKEE